MKIAPLLLSLTLCALAAEKPKTPSEPAQPATENLDLDAIARIRDEGFHHSHIMEYAGGLLDGVGPRLTGSPGFTKAERWSLEQLRGMGASNVHSESWGEFGMGWRQIGTSLEMTSFHGNVPGASDSLVPGYQRRNHRQVIAVPDLKEEKDFDQWKDKLAGKVILYGEAPKIEPDHVDLMEHYDPAKLDHFRSYPLDSDQRDSHVLPNDPPFWEKTFKNVAFLEKVGHFFADEHAVEPRRTIRIGLWGGEEQGMFGSAGYVGNHFATVSYSTKPEEQVVPQFIRPLTGPIIVKPDHAKLDAYFNADNGGGKFLGIFTEGNSAVASVGLPYQRSRIHNHLFAQYRGDGSRLV